VVDSVPRVVAAAIRGCHHIAPPFSVIRKSGKPTAFGRQTILLFTNAFRLTPDPTHGLL
jgi:hypothetical protein